MSSWTVLKDVLELNPQQVFKIFEYEAIETTAKDLELNDYMTFSNDAWRQIEYLKASYIYRTNDLMPIQWVTGIRIKIWSSAAVSVYREVPIQVNSTYPCKIIKAQTIGNYLNRLRLRIVLWKLLNRYSNEIHDLLWLPKTGMMYKAGLRDIAALNEKQ